MPSPLAQFHSWLESARESGLHEPTAMALATADARGAPAVRMLLLKGADEAGFVFYTNLGSPKASDLNAVPLAEMCFYWPPNRQVRVRGNVEPVAADEADAYFATRPRLSQLGAWASRQSKPLGGYAEFERTIATIAVRFGTGAIPRPPHWSGYRLAPTHIEFWEQRPFRLHDRVLHTRTLEGWMEQRLFP